MVNPMFNTKDGVALFRYGILAIVLLANSLHAQRNLKDIPDTDPEIERKSFILADGFEVNLFAADPQIAKPIHMNFDEKGRLWIAGSSVYPHIEPGQSANDKILILEDTNGDGKSDKTTVFADGLLIPTGVAPAPGGCYVANSTELIHLIDTDGDDKADLRKVVLSGFGTEDTHHLLHTLRWGHDGCLYMNQSIYIHSHIETPYGVKRLNAGGIWRFRPETLELDVMSEGLVNPWGHHFDKWGQSFATDGAGGQGINYMFPGSVYVTAYNARRVLQGLNPGSPKYCGLEVIGGDHLPKEFQGNMITNDFRANRVCRFVVSENGTSAYSSRQETELIKTKHVAFRPIDVKMGSDGAIYIADWYNPIIQHGEVDFRDPRRDQVHGRIWRLTYKGRDPLKHPDLTNTSIRELLGHLKSNQQWVRLHAKRMLKEYVPNQVVDELNNWVKALDSADENVEHQMLEALWSYQSIRQVNESLLQKLLNSRDHRVKAAAIRVAVDWRERLKTIDPFSVFKTAATDSHPRVRLEAVRALSKYENAKAVTAALNVLDQAIDPFLDFAVWKTVGDLKDVWLPELTAGRFNFNDNLDHLTFALSAVNSPQVVSTLFGLIDNKETDIERRLNILSIIALQGTPKDLGRVFQAAVALSSTDAASAAKIVQQLSRVSQQRSVRPNVATPQLIEMMKSKHPALSAAAIQIAGIWKVNAAIPLLIDLANQNSLGAVDSLAMIGGEKSKQTLVSLTSPDRSMAVRQRATNVMTLIDKNLAAEKAVALLIDSPTDWDPKYAIDFLLKTSGGPGALISALEKKNIDAEVAKLAIRAAQSSPTPSKPLITAFRKSGKLDLAKWIASPELTDSLMQKVAAKGDPVRGELIYRREKLQCMKCHAIGGAGGIVGPEMNSIGASAQVDYLIESLLEPSKKVKENYNSRIVQTIDGLQFSGIPIRENKQQTVLRTAEGKVVSISAEDIEATKDGRSLMPEGLVDGLAEDELVDLVTFLSRLGKVGDFAVGKQQYARKWETLIWTAEANRRMNRTSFDSAASGEDVFKWRLEYTLVNGIIDVMSLPTFKIHRNTPKTSFLSTKLEVTVAGSVKLKFDAADRIKLWVDGKPKKIETVTTLELEKGIHQIVIAVRNDSETKARVELLAGESVAAQWK